jgi:hypothetical protein
MSYWMAVVGVVSVEETVLVPHPMVHAAYRSSSRRIKRE